MHSFHSVLYIGNRIISKGWSAETLLYNYVREKEGEPSFGLQFWQLEKNLMCFLFCFT